MKRHFKFAIPVVLLMLSASASAASRLTPQECNSYPFVPVKGEITHQDLMRELAELESVGYQPGADDTEYPNDIMQAEKRLQAKYQAECKPGAQAGEQGASMQSSNN